jgi:GT2 family glycosyltransferase
MRLASVVVNYRTAAATISAVRSIQDTNAVQEVIVVDNGSDDGSFERLQVQVAGATLTRLPRNAGFSGGVNAGIAIALQRGADAVLLLNSDAIIESGTISGLIAAIAETAQIAGPLLVDPSSRRIESAGVTYSLSTGRISHRRHPGDVARATPVGMTPVSAVSGAAMLIRRDVFEQIGLFAEAYFYGFEDLDFCLRARAAGFRTVCVGSAVVEHAGQGSIGRSSRRLYFAARNHLLLATRVGPQVWPLRTARAASIVALNMAHAVLRADGDVRENVAAVARGVRDHLRGRYGPDEAAWI